MDLFHVKTPQQAAQLCSGPTVQITIQHPSASTPKLKIQPLPSQIHFTNYPLNLLKSISPTITRSLSLHHNIPIPKGLRLYHPLPAALDALLRYILEFLQPPNTYPFIPAVTITNIIPLLPLQNDAFYGYGGLVEAAHYLANTHLCDRIWARMRRIALGQVRINDCKAIYSDEYCARGKGGEWMRQMASWSVARRAKVKELKYKELYERFMMETGEEKRGGRELKEDVEAWMEKGREAELWCDRDDWVK